jgi:hypothetical protein
MRFEDVLITEVTRIRLDLSVTAKEEKGKKMLRNGNEQH